MTDETTSSKTPSHAAYMIRERKGGKAIWTRIGAAWLHGDGNGLNIEFHAAPLDGRMTLRIATEKKD
jgi:hypothetical protein